MRASFSGFAPLDTHKMNDIYYAVSKGGLEPESECARIGSIFNDKPKQVNRPNSRSSWSLLFLFILYGLGVAWLWRVMLGLILDYYKLNLFKSLLLIEWRNLLICCFFQLSFSLTSCGYHNSRFVLCQAPISMNFSILEDSFLINSESPTILREHRITRWVHGWSDFIF